MLEHMFLKRCMDRAARCTICLRNAYDNDKKRGTRKMDYYRAFPFYMGYQGYGQWAQPGMIPEDRILEDLEYLQQMYPTYAKKYQSVISSVVDKVDYDDSFIYDQYPDKLTIQRMVASVMAVIKTNEEKENRSGNMSNTMPPMSGMSNGMMSMPNPSNTMTPMSGMSNGMTSMPNPSNTMTPMSDMPNEMTSMPNMPGTMTPMSDMPGTTMPMSGMPNTAAPTSEVTNNTLTERAPWSEKEPWIRELVTVLMYYEILARRRKKNKQWQNNAMGNRYYI